MNLLSDAAQSETWPKIKPQLTKGKVSYAHPPSEPLTCIHKAILTPEPDPLLLPRLLPCLQESYQRGHTQ